MEKWKNLYEDNHYKLECREEIGCILSLDCGVEVHFTSLQEIESVEGEDEFVLYENNEAMGYLSKSELPDSLCKELGKKA